jgi:hypothetical protein
MRLALKMLQQRLAMGSAGHRWQTEPLQVEFYPLAPPEKR